MKCRYITSQCCITGARVTWHGCALDHCWCITWQLWACVSVQFVLMDKDAVLVLMPVSSINDCTLQSGTAGKIHWSISGEFYQSGSDIYATVKCILQNHYNMNTAPNGRKEEKWMEMALKGQQVTLKIWIGQDSFYRSASHFCNNIQHHFRS